MSQLVYPELSYKISGLLFDLYNELGYGYQEKYYSRAFALLLKENKLEFKREICVPIIFKDKIIGRYYLDFVIDDKIALEFKVSNEFRNQYTQQILAYLKSHKLKLGLVVLFTSKGIEIKRLVN
jgi:GxxExxY protein